MLRSFSSDVLGISVLLCICPAVFTDTVAPRARGRLFEVRCYSPPSPLRFAFPKLQTIFEHTRGMPCVTLC